MQVQTVLQVAMQDYNIWAQRGARYYDPVKAYGELRGIFFNKLIARARDAGFQLRPYHRWRSQVLTLHPSDIICKFDANARLHEVSLETWVNGKIKEMLGTNVPPPRPAEPYIDPAYNVINNIVNQIVNYKL